MKNKSVKIIYCIIVPLILLVIVLAFLGRDWNDFSETFIIWLFFLIIVLIVELHLFAPEEKILSRIKKRIRKLFPWFMKIFIVIIILLSITIVIGLIISSIKIPPDQIEIINSENKHLFIEKYKIGNFKVTLKNNSKWSATDIIIETSIFYKGNDSLVVFLSSQILEDSRLRSNSFFTYYVHGYYPYKKSNINHPPKKLFIYEFLDRSFPAYDLSKFLVKYREEYPEYSGFSDEFILQLAFKKDPQLSKINWVNIPETIPNLYYSHWAKKLKKVFNNPPDYLFRESRHNKDWRFNKIYEELKKDNPEFYNTIKSKYLFDSDFYVKHEIISVNRYSFLDYILDEFY